MSLVHLMKKWWLLAGLLISLCSPLCGEDRPNVILIVVDDPGWADLGEEKFRPDDVSIPHLDALAAGSTRYGNGYVTAPICNASRLALLTGRYQHRFQTVWYNGPGLEGSKAPTIAEVLRVAGYRTGMVGKVHHGSRDGKETRNHPLNHGYESFFGFMNSTAHYLKRGKEFLRPALGPLAMGPWMRDREAVGVQGFSTRIFGEEALKFIKADGGKPFFLHLSFNAIHNYTHQLPEDHLRSKSLPAFPDFDPGKESLAEWRAKLSYPAHPHGRGYYLGQLHFLDVEIGRLMDALKESGEDSRTVIFLIGDNGGSLVTYARNSPLKGGKYTLHEGGVRVPFWVRWPGGKDAGADDRVVSSLDLFPTIVDLWGTSSGWHGRARLAEGGGGQAAILGYRIPTGGALGEMEVVAHEKKPESRAADHANSGR